MLYRSIDTIMALAYTGKYADFQIKLCNMSYQHETQFSSKARIGLSMSHLRDKFSVPFLEALES